MIEDNEENKELLIKLGFRKNDTIKTRPIEQDNGNIKRVKKRKSTK